MSAISVFGPEAHHFVDLPRSRPTGALPRTTINTVPATAEPESSGNRAATDYQLTDRGIAVVMVIAAMILTTAIAVIGITVVVIRRCKASEEFPARVAMPAHRSHARLNTEH